MTGPKFLILCGLSFAGKSTLAQAVSARFGYAEVDVDVTKACLYGAEVRDADLKPADWVRIYAETDRQIETLLKSGVSVVDASRNFTRAERDTARAIAFRLGVPLLIIYVDAPVELARRRLLENRLHPSRRDVSDPDFEDALRAMQPPGAEESPLIFHAGQDIEIWISEHAASFT